MKPKDLDKILDENKFIDKLTDFDCTIWDSDSGTIKIKQFDKVKGASYRYYLDIANRYDKTFKTKKALAEYLKNVHATHVGYEQWY